MTHNFKIINSIKQRKKYLLALSHDYSYLIERLPECLMIHQYTYIYLYKFWIFQLTFINAECKLQNTTYLISGRQELNNTESIEVTEH